MNMSTRRFGITARKQLIVGFLMLLKSSHVSLTRCLTLCEYSATYNGEDITQQLSSLTSASIFKTPAINSNAILSITYEQRPSGISQTENGQQLRINVSGNTVSVTDCPYMIEVFTLQGHHVVSQPTSGGKAQFTLPAGQCYLIKAGKKTVKVLL